MDARQQQLIFSAAALLCASIGSLHDVRSRKIPNGLSAAALALGTVAHTALGGWAGLADSALAGAIAGGIFLVFYAAGGMGAGDVKLMAAVGCLCGLTSLSCVLTATVLAGGIFAVVMSLCNGRLLETLRNVGALLEHHARRGIRPHPELNLSTPELMRMPFALPIASGCLISFCSQAMGVRL